MLIKAFLLLLIAIASFALIYRNKSTADVGRKIAMPVDSSRRPFSADGVSIDSKQIKLKNASIKAVMDAISYTYKVPVVYIGALGTGNYTAVINLNTPLKEVISVLNNVGIRNEFDGEKIRVVGE